MGRGGVNPYHPFLNTPVPTGRNWQRNVQQQDPNAGSSRVAIATAEVCRMQVFDWQGVTSQGRPC